MRISDWSSDVCSSDLVVEAGFSGEVSTEATDGVFDAAFLPWGVRIAEEGLDSELPFDAVMAGKFGAIVEGDRPSQRRGHWLEQLDDGVGDGIGLEAVLGHGDGEPRVAFMCEEDRLSGGGEEHGIGLPMACLLAGGNAVG